MNPVGFCIEFKQSNHYCWVVCVSFGVLDSLGWLKDCVRQGVFYSSVWLKDFGKDCGWLFPLLINKNSL